MDRHRFPIYKKRGATIMILVACALLSFLIFALFAPQNNSADRLLLIFLVLVIINLAPLPFILSTLFASVLIDENGVAYKKYNMKWEMIGEIGISPVQRISNFEPCIYFSTSAVEDEKKIMHPSNTNGDLIILQYRETAIETIQTYWAKPIKNIEKLQ
jgi:hypothetical protein